MYIFYDYKNLFENDRINNVLNYFVIIMRFIWDIKQISNHYQ
jgi:hypothetical protein